MGIRSYDFIVVPRSVKRKKKIISRRQRRKQGGGAMLDTVACFRVF